MTKPSSLCMVVDRTVGTTGGGDSLHLLMGCLIPQVIKFEFLLIVFLFIFVFCLFICFCFSWNLACRCLDFLTESWLFKDCWGILVLGEAGESAGCLCTRMEGVEEDSLLSWAEVKTFRRRKENTASWLSITLQSTGQLCFLLNCRY